MGHECVIPPAVREGLAAERLGDEALYPWRRAEDREDTRLLY
jgi:hypothetical protein